jgi:hypothetical protein
MNWWFHAWLVIFIHEFFIFLFLIIFRWTTLSLPCAGMWTSFHSVVEFATASTQSRRPIGTGQKSAVSMRHLWQRIRHRVITTHSHGQGKHTRCSFSFKFILLCVLCLVHRSLSVCYFDFLYSRVCLSRPLCVPVTLPSLPPQSKKKPLPFEFSIGPSKKWKTKNKKTIVSTINWTSTIRVHRLLRSLDFCGFHLIEFDLLHTHNPSKKRK